MDVSVIIVNYNTSALLEQCLNSVFSKTVGVSFEVIVVDNNSSDDSKELVIEKFNQIQLIESSKNLGFGNANNLGAQYAKGRYLFFLNPDTILVNNSIEILCNYMDVHKNVGICGGNLFDENMIPTHSYSMFLPSFLWELNIFFGKKLDKLLYGKNSEFNHSNNPRTVGYITGADLMIRADLFNELNGFDPEFFMYYEETELTYRVKAKGCDVYNIPQAQIIHLEGKSFSNNLDKIKLSLKSYNMYYEKTHNGIGKIVCRSMYRLTILSRLCWYGITKNKGQKEYWKSIAQSL